METSPWNRKLCRISTFKTSLEEWKQFQFFQGERHEKPFKTSLEEWKLRRYRHPKAPVGSF